MTDATTDSMADAMTIYEQYDRQSKNASPDIEEFGGTYLVETARFTQQQAAIVAQIVVSFVDDTVARHKRYFASPTAGTDAGNDINRELRKAGKPGSFLHRLQCWLLGRGDSFMEYLKPYLGEQQTKEIGDLFDPDAKIEQVSVEAAQDLLRGRMVLEQGNLAREMQKILASDDQQNEEKMPQCLRRAFKTDLLSAEEAVAIKLLAFDLLTERVLKDEESRDAAPFCALSAARASYDLVVSLKATIRTAQLEMLSEALNLGDKVGKEVR